MTGRVRFSWMSPDQVDWKAYRAGPDNNNRVLATAMHIPPCAGERGGRIAGAPRFLPRPPTMTDPIRLAKRVAELRACSRREAEQLIAGGWVRVMEPTADGKLDALALNDTNQMELRVYGNEARRQAVLVARLDNLGKGASGAAVQNLMLMTGR